MHAGAPQVSAEERERAKRVVYGIVYGQMPFGLAQSLADQGISTKAAEGMIDSFLARFPGQSAPYVCDSAVLHVVACKPLSV
jgi:DNA polymerase I-like protein with 3'-5' exonuclease and polymerase domains